MTLSLAENSNSVHITRTVVLCVCVCVCVCVSVGVEVFKNSMAVFIEALPLAGENMERLFTEGYINC